MNATRCLLNHSGRFTADENLSALSASGFVFDANDVFVDDTKCTVPACERIVLQRVISHLWPGDVLIVTDLSPLGNSVRDAVATLRTVRRMGAFVVFACPLHGGPTEMNDESLIRSLELVVELDHDMRQARAKQASNAATNRGVQIGRPSGLDRVQRASALRALSEGRTITDVAREFRTSRQTIMRLRNANRYSVETRTGPERVPPSERR